MGPIASIAHHLAQMATTSDELVGARDLNEILQRLALRTQELTGAEPATCTAISRAALGCAIRSSAVARPRCHRKT